MSRIFQFGRLLPALVCASVFTLAACDYKVDFNGPEKPDDRVYNEWVTYEPENTVCADGTQYRYFIKYRENAENVLVLFEGGGACWDWETCTGSAGALGALGVDCVMRQHNGTATGDCVPTDYADTYYGIPDNLPISQYEGLIKKLAPWLRIAGGRAAIDTVLPLANDGADKAGNTVSPMNDWNLVFVPYCTADLYAGNKEAQYVNPEDPEDIVTFKHYGLRNTLKVAEELNEIFPNVPEFAMNGCSAGGAGVMATYHFFRSKMEGIQKGYVFSDAGPFFPTSPENAHSGPLHEAVREAWGISSVFDMLIEEHPDIVPEEPEDVSDLYSILSRTYPNDKFSVAHTLTDYNYSLYSYTSFNGIESRANSAEDAKLIYKYWLEDNLNLIDRLDELDNFSYYFPFWRRTNASHCISLIGIEDLPNIDADPIGGFMSLINDPSHYYYSGTEMEVGGETITYRDHVSAVLAGEQHREVDRSGNTRMGLRMYCTPDFNSPETDQYCQCYYENWQMGEDECDCRKGTAGEDVDCSPYEVP